MRALATTAAVVLMLGSSALADAPPPKKGVPVLSGAYTYTWIESCFNTDGTLAGVSHTTGTLAFDKSTGMATLNGFQAHGEPPVLTTISGSAAYSNTKATVTINGQNTNFQNGPTQLTAGPGITITNLQVVNATTMTARFAIAAGAALGPRTITVTTGSEEAALPNGFRIQ